MNQQTRNAARSMVPALAALAMSIALIHPATANAQVPEGQVYDVTFLLRNFEDAETERGLDCFRFRSGQLCSDSLGICGALVMLDRAGRLRPWTAELAFEDDDGTSIDIAFHGAAEPRGRGSSIAATGYVTGVDDEGSTVRRNVGITGISVPSCSIPDEGESSK